jgi:hypothetical protein
MRKRAVSIIPPVFRTRRDFCTRGAYILKKLKISLVMPMITIAISADLQDAAALTGIQKIF